MKSDLIFFPNVEVMAGEFDWEAVRADFPVARRVAYLNSAAAGPVSRGVWESCSRFYAEMMEEGDARWDAWLERRENIRRRVAEFINAEPDEIAFTVNTSSGMNLIVDMLEGRGEVVSCELEFPVTTVPWIHRGVPVRFVKTPGGELDMEELAQAMKERAGIISLSHVQYSNGLRLDLESLGRMKGERVLVVNASQSAGVLGIDVKAMKIDALCATGHKWMLAGYGSGFVYLSRQLLDQSRPRAAGWLSVEEPHAMRNNEFRLRADAASRAELGCPHFAGIFALGASVEYLLAIGKERVEERALALNRQLTESLTSAGWRVLSPLRRERMRSAQTLLETRDPKRMVEHLAAHGVAVTEKPQGIRISTHFFNHPDEIERLLAALDSARRIGL